MNLDDQKTTGGSDRPGDGTSRDAAVMARRQFVATLAREAPSGVTEVPRVIWRDLEGIVRAAEVTRALTLGRAPGCAVELGHEAVSWVHALLSPNDAEFWIVDLGSTAGTTVNGNRVGEVLSPLRSGDVIELGSFPLVFLA